MWPVERLKTPRSAPNSLNTMILATVLLGLSVAWLLTAAMRRYALSTQMIDLPNDRSSHSIPTPRGGGVAIVLAFIAVVGAAGLLDAVPQELLLGLLGSGGLVATAGFIDDRQPLPARWRFLAHALAAIWTLWVLGGIPRVPLFGSSIDLGWFGLALAAAYLVWMVNLCNFMDGIDGIASVETITVALGGALCWWLATGTANWHWPVAFAACVAGFLAWNYPPARIFMGDAGSGFLGMMLGFFSLWAGQAAPEVFWCWFVLLGGFMVDATTTLVRRVRRGEKFNVAHRSHAYQFASRKYASHQRVTLALAVINVLWLLPIAVAVALRLVDGALAVVVSYAPLVLLAFKFKAGDRLAQDACAA